MANDVSLDKLTNLSESVLEALTDLVPQYRGKELFELPKSLDFEYYDDYLKDLFLQGLISRTSLTDGGIRFLKGLLDSREYYSVIKVIVNNSFRTDFPLSVKTLDDLLTPLSMVKRDEMWTQVISDSSELYEPLLNLAQWGWSASPEVLGNIEKDNLKNVIHLLGWTLSTTYIELRDKASRGLINILKNNQELLLDFICCFESNIFQEAFG